MEVGCLVGEVLFEGGDWATGGKVMFWAGVVDSRFMWAIGWVVELWTADWVVNGGFLLRLCNCSRLGSCNFG